MLFLAKNKQTGDVLGFTTEKARSRWLGMGLKKKDRKSVPTSTLRPGTRFAMVVKVSRRILPALQRLAG